MKKYRYMLVSLLFAASFLLPTLVTAEEDTGGTDGSTSKINDDSAKIEKARNEYRQKQDRRQNKIKTEREGLRDQAKIKAEERKLEARQKACQNQSKNFSKRFNGITKRSEDRKGYFATIYDKIQVFVDENDLIVEDYDALKSDIDAKKLALVDAHAQSRAIVENFSCENEGFKEDATAYRQAVLAEIKAFKEYKSSLKALIKAVKQAHNAANDEAETKPEESETTDEE